ncbi:MAG: hypothetical protein U0Q15_09915 [Kineosporiaceae bacterium]
MTVAPASRTQVMDPSAAGVADGATGSLPRLLWSPDDGDPGWFHTAEWELSADWDVPAEQEWAPGATVVDITDAAIAARETAAAVRPQPQVELPAWLVSPEPFGAADLDPVPATVSLPRALPRRRDLRAGGAHHTLPARREVALLPGLPAEEGVPALVAAEARADETTVLPRRRDLRRGRRELLVVPAALTAPPQAPAALAVSGEGLGVAETEPATRRGAHAPAARPSALATTVARAGVVSVLVAVGVATVGGHKIGLGVGDGALEAAGKVSPQDAAAALKQAPLPNAAPVTLWGARPAQVAPKFVDEASALAGAGLAESSKSLAAASSAVIADQKRQAEADKTAKAAAAKAAADKAAEKAAADKAAAAREGGSTRASRSYSGSSVKSIARSMMLAEYGWGETQFSCLNSLWNRESGWNYRAQNPSSGAYGIPQSLPGRKMASAGADWRTNPATQIEWGLDYIHDRYGTPCGAWSHSQRRGFY